MHDQGPAVELIWWDHEHAVYRWTYRRSELHRAGRAWTWELAELALSCARSHRTVLLPVRLPAGREDRASVAARAAPSEDEPVDEHDDITTAPAIPTVRDRMHLLSEGRIQTHLQASAIQLDGKVVTDLDQPAPPPARVVILPS